MTLSLSLPQIAQLVCFSVMIACGQTLFKITAGSTGNLGSLVGLLGLAGNIWFWAALILYSTATLLWIFILQQVPLSLAYPFVALGFIFVPMISYFLFKEPINLYYMLGMACILTGLGLITVLGSK